MGKAKKKIADRDRQFGSLVQSVETISKHLIDCCICGSEDEQEGGSDETFAAFLYDEGWRHSASDKFGIEGPMCPECAQTPDADRGEDDTESE